MSTREISETIKELYDVDVSAALISNVTTRVINKVIQWQNRPLDAVYPNAQVQLCVVHMIRNSMRFVSWKDYKRVAAQLRTIYQAATEQQALEALEQFDEDWKNKYPVIAEQWRRHWDHLITMFHYPE